jgi:hypothetical protein
MILQHRIFKIIWRLLALVLLWLYLSAPGCPEPHVMSRENLEVMTLKTPVIFYGKVINTEFNNPSDENKASITTTFQIKELIKKCSFLPIDDLISITQMVKTEQHSHYYPFVDGQEYVFFVDEWSMCNLVMKSPSSASSYADFFVPEHTDNIFRVKSEEGVQTVTNGQRIDSLVYDKNLTDYYEAMDSDIRPLKDKPYHTELESFIKGVKERTGSWDKMHWNREACNYVRECFE